MNNFLAHILVVDDDDGIRKLVKQFLNENNYLVTTAHSAEEAQNKIKFVEFDLIVLDIMMSGKSGLEFLIENKKSMYKRSKYVIRGYESLKTGKMVEQIIGNQVSSNIIGYYDKPDRNLGKGAPQCRLTQFNKNHMEKFQKVIPFIQAINTQFKKLIPEQYRKQYRRAHQTDFKIDKTAFSTVTINHNWRTALHQDSGDFKEGFGNLVVCEKGKYKGGYTGFPQFGVAFDVRQGDFLAMDVHQWHANTALKGKNYSRMSVVCYLREKMIRCQNLKLEGGN